MGAPRKSVRLAIEGTDLMVSIFPDDGEVRVTSAKFDLECSQDGPPRDSGHTLVVTRGDENPVGRDITRRPTHHITRDLRVVER